MIKLNGKEVEFEHFPDGTPFFKFDPGGLSTVYIEWNYHNNEEMIFLMFLTRHLQNHGVKDINLVMPYVPNARMDRVKMDEDVFTLKYFAEFINYLAFKSVYVLDPHSTVTEALINNIRIMPNDIYPSSMSKILSYDDETDTFLFFPDEGAMKRYAPYADREYTFGIKQRDFATREIVGFDIAGDIKYIKNCNVVIIDDICGSGGTILHSAKKLKELGAKKIYVIVTHCENTIIKGELLNSNLIERIFTTDSTLTIKNAKIDVIQV